MGTFLFATILMFKTKGDLSDIKFKRMTRFTTGINVKKHCLNKYYFSIFMVRRTIYASIPAIFIGYQGF